MNGYGSTGPTGVERVTALFAEFGSFVGEETPAVPLIGALAGALLALSAGWWGLREVLRRPVIDTLRAAQQE